MQSELPPKIALIRFCPCCAAQPEPGRALVARRGAVAEIQAAGPLQQVAADGRHVAHLGRGGLRQRLREQWEVLLDTLVVGDCGETRHGADPRAVRVHRDARQRQSADANQCRRRQHVFLQQLQHVGAAGDQHRSLRGGEIERRLQAVRLGVAERLHLNLLPHGGVRSVRPPRVSRDATVLARDVATMGPGARRRATGPGARCRATSPGRAASRTASTMLV